MSINSALSSSDETLTIEVAGRCDLVFNPDFSNAKEALEKAAAP